MEVLSSYLPKARWLRDESKAAKWTQAENKLFEKALALYDTDTSDRWYNVTALLPGKTVCDVIKHYKKLEDDISDIEAGLVPIAGCDDSVTGFPFELVDHNGYVYDEYNYGYSPGYKRGPRPGFRPGDHERKKGVPWTEQEHKLFLMGLKKYGKGDWRNISRNCVVTRTPTQVASHAQKYYMRQLSGRKDKRRASIHDITTVNLETETLSPDTNTSSKMSNSSDNSVISVQTQHQITSSSMPGTQFQWDQSDNIFESMQENVLISPPYGNGSYGLKMEGHNYLGNQGMNFQIQPTQYYSHG